MAKVKAVNVATYDELIGVLRAEIKRRAKNDRIALILFVGALIFIPLAGLEVWLVEHTAPTGLIGSFFGGLLLFPAVFFRTTPKFKVETADGAQDRQVTGYLLEAVMEQDPKVSELAQEVLCERLDEVNSTGDLTAAEKSRLLDSLAYASGSDYSTAALEAIRRMGDSRSIGYLEKFKLPDDMIWRRSTNALAQDVLADLRQKSLIEPASAVADGASSS